MLFSAIIVIILLRRARTCALFSFLLGNITRFVCACVCVCARLLGASVSVHLANPASLRCAVNIQFVIPISIRLSWFMNCSTCFYVETWKTVQCSTWLWLYRTSVAFCLSSAPKEVIRYYTSIIIIIPFFVYPFYAYNEIKKRRRKKIIVNFLWVADTIRVSIHSCAISLDSKIRWRKPFAQRIYDKFYETEEVKNGKCRPHSDAYILYDYFQFDII